MTVYKGYKSTLRWAGITLMSFVGLILLIYFFTSRGFLPWFFMVSLFLICIPTYQGMILGISINDEKIVIRRPLNQQTIKLRQAAFCAVHDIGEGKSLLFIFVRHSWGGGHRIRGIKAKMSYEEVMDALSKGGRVQDLKVNFSRAVKVPVSMVENGEELKERILDSIDAHHCKAVYD